mgnify:CR=1 FL=1
MIKRLFSAMIVLIFAFSLVGCNSQEKGQDKIFSLVEKNYDAIVTACENKDAESLLKISGITKVNIVDGYVLAYCMGAGIAPSSQEYGFYYSEENRPIGVFDGYIVCDFDEMTQDGNGYTFVDEWSNSFYTEHISGNIYFYSNAL